MPNPAETITVPIECPAGREGPLAWGQRAILATVSWLDTEDTYFNIPLDWALPGRHSVADVAGAIARLTETHESLRTVLVRAGADGEWRQRVERRDSLALEVYDIDASADVAEQSREVAAALAARPFRLTEEWPVRWAVIRSEGAVPAVVLALSHTAVDNWSLGVMRQDLLDLLAGQVPEPPARQPLDQVDFEGSARGAGRSTESLRHWARTLERAPHSMFDYPARTPEAKRYVRLGLDSRSLAVATHIVADACRTSTTTVLLTAAACVLGAYTGHDPALLRLIVGNRHDPDARRTVSPLAQDGLLLLPRGDGTFHDAVKRGYLPAINAYKHGHYDPAVLAETIRRNEHRWGVVHDKSAFFNDVRLTDRWTGLPAVADEGGLKALRAHNRVFEVGAYDRVDCKLFLAVTDRPDSAVLHLLGDTAYITRDELTMLLNAMETLLVESAFGEVPLGELAAAVGITPPDRPGDWVRVRGGRVDPEAVRRLVAEAAGAEASIVVEAGEPWPRLVAHVAAAPGGPTGPELHVAVVDALRERTGVTAPDWYVLHDRALPATEDPEAWQTLGVLWQGDGRQEPPPIFLDSRPSEG